MEETVGYAEVLKKVQLTGDTSEVRARVIVAHVTAWLGEDVTEDPQYAKVVWGVGDVQSLFDVTDEEADDFLNRNAKYVQEAMTERGWCALEDLGVTDGLKKKEPD